MFRLRKALCVILALMMMLAVPITAFAASTPATPVFIVTDYYGNLRGTTSQSGQYLNTRTWVTSNQYNGTLHTIIEITDGISTTISTSHYTSSAGALSLSKSTYMVPKVKTVLYPEYAFVTHEIRGGTKAGEWGVHGLDIDSGVFD